MTPTEFLAALHAAGMSARSFARLVGIPERTAQSYRDKRGPPPHLAEWLNRRVADIARDPAIQHTKQLTSHKNCVHSVCIDEHRGIRR